MDKKSFMVTLEICGQYDSKTKREAIRKHIVRVISLLINGDLDLFCTAELKKRK